MERTVDLNLGAFRLTNVAPSSEKRGSVLLSENGWYIGKSIQTKLAIEKNAIIVFLLHQGKIPFSLDLCADISNICNSRKMYPFIVTATDVSDWYRSGLETIIVPSLEHGKPPADVEQLFAPDVTVEIGKFISVFGRGVCKFSDNGTD